jgi:hypothetical protein
MYSNKVLRCRFVLEFHTGIVRFLKQHSFKEQDKRWRGHACMSSEVEHIEGCKGLAYTCIFQPLLP